MVETAREELAYARCRTVTAAMYQLGDLYVGQLLLPYSFIVSNIYTCIYMYMPEHYDCLVVTKYVW